MCEWVTCFNRCFYTVLLMNEKCLAILLILYLCWLRNVYFSLLAYRKHCTILLRLYYPSYSSESPSSLDDFAFYQQLIAEHRRFQICDLQVPRDSCGFPELRGIDKTEGDPGTEIKQSGNRAAIHEAPEITT